MMKCYVFSTGVIVCWHIYKYSCDLDVIVIPHWYGTFLFKHDIIIIIDHNTVWHFFGPSVKSIHAVMLTLTVAAVLVDEQP